MWDQVQSCQVNFGFPLELSVYFTEPLWFSAQDVLDVGTGNGDYLCRLGEVFPEKRYLGVDLSSDLVRIANNRSKLDYVLFETDDIDHLSRVVDRQFDFTIARLLFQHLDNISLTLSVLSKIVRPGGILLVIDSHDSLRFFWPDVPNFWKFFSAYKDNQYLNRRDRDITSSLSAISETTNEWKFLYQKTIIIPSTISNNLSHYRRYYYLMLEIVERVGLLEFDLRSAKDEWSHWCRNDHAYTQLALDFVILQKA